MARSCAGRPWTTIIVWLIIAALAVFSTWALLGGALTNKMEFNRDPESERGLKLLESRLRGPRKFTEIVIVSSGNLTVDDPRYKAGVDILAAKLISLAPEVVEGGTYYYLQHDEALVSADRHSTILPVIMSGGEVEAKNNVGKVVDAVRSASEQTGLTIYTTGAASVNGDFNQLAEEDLKKAEFIGIPIAVLILLLVFGSLVAAALPLSLAGFSILVAVGITAVVGQRFQMTFFVINMITMMGLAVGIDYSLFVVSRYREELMQGRPYLEAIEVAGETASRAVLFSGMTVILALLGMMIVPMSLFYSLGAGAIFVVAVAVSASLTLLPAVLSIFKRHINALKMPWEKRIGTAAEEAQADHDGNRKTGRFWNWVTAIVMKRPLLSALLAGTVLVVPALFYFQIDTGANGTHALPDNFPSKQGYLLLERNFSVGLASPVEVVIDGNVNSPEIQQAINTIQEDMKHDGVFSGQPQVQINQAGDLALVSMPVAAAEDSDTATGAVRRLRDTYVPQAFAGTGANVMVSGVPAINLDYFQITDRYRPVVFAFVLSLSFILLMIVFRSIVVPLKAIIMNFLSVGAAYGLIVLVFQKGIGARTLGFDQVSKVEAWVPLFLFSVLFGLSMDYHVFLLGRIRERYMKTGNNSESVAFGLASTGRIITGAALIMVAVFAGFASGDLVMFQQIGFGLAIAVLLDATIVRSVLVPATMKMLGDWNWYLPRWLKWLPELHFEQRDSDSRQKQGGA